MEDKKLYRSKSDKVLFGLCGGLGRYFGVDSTLIRILFVLLVAPGGFGIFAYVIMSLITPMEPGTGESNANEEVKEFTHKMKEGAHEMAKEIKERRHHGGFRSLLGVILIAVGISSLFGKIFPFYHIGSFFWPILVFLFGAYLLIKRK